MYPRIELLLWGISCSSQWSTTGLTGLTQKAECIVNRFIAKMLVGSICLWDDYPTHCYMCASFLVGASNKALFHRFTCVYFFN